MQKQHTKKEEEAQRSSSVVVSKKIIIRNNNINKKEKEEKSVVRENTNLYTVSLLLETHMCAASVVRRSEKKRTRPTAAHDLCR